MHWCKTSCLSFLHIIIYFAILSKAQHNVTVNNTSPSIKYEGGAGDVNICQLTPDGLVKGGQPGCFFVPSNCAAGVSMGLSNASAASFSFKGSAIYIDSVLNSLSSIYTVTLDGQSTDIDGVRPSPMCAPLFFRTGLDPGSEHQVRLSVKGPSPSRNTSIPENESTVRFSLISYTFTEGAVVDPSRTNGADERNQPSGAGVAFRPDIQIITATLLFAWFVCLWPNWS